MDNFLIYFLSGLFLNFIPCVLPILSVKLYDIIKYSQTRENEKNLEIVSLGTVAGIVAVFCSFGIVGVLFKILDIGFNLGFHFQNPYFLIFVIFLLFLFLLNLLNFFNIHYSPRVIDFIQKKYEVSKKVSSGIFLNNFVTGAFMVLFATPCCLPIIGTIATFSIVNQNCFQILYNFFITGLGMSSPFLFIIFFPDKFNFLKKYKNLLKYFDNFIIFVISLTIIWLLFVLEIEIGFIALIIVVLFMYLIFAQFKFIKKVAHRAIIIFIIILLGIFSPILISDSKSSNKVIESLWENDISLNQISNYVNENKNVFVNISAKWCMVCNLNEVSIFSNRKTVEFFNKNNFVLTKVDVTNNSNNALKFFDDDKIVSVPTYIVYNKKFPSGCRFSGKLTEGEFFKNINDCL